MNEEYLINEANQNEMDYINVVRAGFKQCGDKKKEVRLPINSFCGLKAVSIEINEGEINDEVQYWLSIFVHYHEHNHNVDGLPDFTTRNLYHYKRKTLEEVLTHFDDLADNSYLDKSSQIIRGNEEEQNKIKEDYKKFYEKYKNHKSVKINYGECCVCYEHTRNRTSCKHYVCLKCYQNIEPIIEKWGDDDEDDEDDEDGIEPSDWGRIACPMCRQTSHFNF